MLQNVLRSITVFLIVELSLGAKILSILLMHCKSHHQVYHSIWSELSLRGHEVTVFTPISQKDTSLTNLTEIDLSEQYKKLLTTDVISGDIQKENFLIYRYWVIFNDLQSLVEVHLTAAKQLFSKNQTFDLILTEIFHPLVYAFGCRFNVPIIGMSSLGVFLNTFDAIANPSHPIVNPGILTNFANDNNFFEKLSRTFNYHIWYRIFYHWYILPKTDKIAKQFYPQCPYYIGDIEKNLSLILTLNNPFLHPIRPILPSVIELDRVHLKSSKSLPLHLQHYLDKSSQGVIYFSFGTSKSSSTLPNITKKTIFTALSELPFNILLKWDSDEMVNKSKNIFSQKWFPQQDLLRHKNVKAFVSQVGLQSMEEAITNEVPLVGIPFTSDQPTNVIQAIKMGIGLGLDHKTMTSEELKNAILEVVKNKKYKKNIVKVRKILDDQPIRGLEKAIWWIEYVIRHKGAKHLRSPLVDIPWYEYLLLDVLCFAFLLSSILLLICYKIINFIVKLFSKNNKTKLKMQ